MYIIIYVIIFIIIIITGQLLKEAVHWIFIFSHLIKHFFWEKIHCCVSGNSHRKFMFNNNNNRNEWKAMTIRISGRLISNIFFKWEEKEEIHFVVKKSHTRFCCYFYCRDVIFVLRRIDCSHRLIFPVQSYTCRGWTKEEASVKRRKWEIKVSRARNWLNTQKMMIKSGQGMEIVCFHPLPNFTKHFFTHRFGSRLSSSSEYFRLPRPKEYCRALLYST